MNVLFVSASVGNSVSGGQIIGLRNLRAIRAALDSTSVTRAFYTGRIDPGAQIDAEKIGGYESPMHTFLCAICLRAGGLTKNSEKKFRQLFAEQSFDVLFLDSSLLGSLARVAKKLNPNIKVLTYFHNIEPIYLIERCKVDSYKYLALMPSVYAAEKCAIKYSDCLIGISERDSNILRKKYGRSFDSIVPVTIADRFDAQKLKPTMANEILFVGSDFYANVHGLKWLVANVISHMDSSLQLNVIGRGLERIRDSFGHENVNIIGTVDNIDEFYYNARAIVLPVFHGSGMKVKTAEALHYGRYLIGSPEAFVGYELNEMDTVMCKSPSEFSKAILSIRSLPDDGFSIKNRKAFERNFSDAVAIEKFRNLLSDAI